MDKKLIACFIMYGALLPVGFFDLWAMRDPRPSFNVFLFFEIGGYALGIAFIPMLLMVFRTRPTAGYVTALLLGGVLVYGALQRDNREPPNDTVVSSGERVSRAAYPSDLSPETVPSSPAPKIITVVSRQPAEGMTDADMSLDYLRGLEIYTIERIKSKVADHYAAEGHSVPDTRIRSESNYIEVQGKKLAIVRFFEANNAGNGVFIIGLVKDELVRVGCTIDSKYQIEITSGDCGAKIEQTFGIAYH